MLTNVMMFLAGMGSITTIYEIAKTARSSRSQKIKKMTDQISRKNK